MGGYYVPNIQRPGFGYQRRSEDDEDQFDDGSSDWGGGDWSGGGGGTPASDGPSASSATADPQSSLQSSPQPYQQPNIQSQIQDVQTASGTADASSATSGYPPPVPEDWTTGGDLPIPEKWTDYRPTRDFSLPSRGGAGETRTDTEMNLGEPPVPQEAEIPSGTDIPGIGQAPMGRPSRVPPPVSSHAEQEKLKQMIKAGPKRSILGTIAAAAAGFGAGYVNAASRTRNPVPVPTQFMRNVSLRAPGGGAWDTKLARQQQLAEQEQGEEKRALSAQQIQGQAEEREARAEELRQRGDYLGQVAKTGARAEEDRQKQQTLQRIIAMGGRTPQVRSFPANNIPEEVSKSRDWNIRVDPYDPNGRIAVRPDPGDQVDDETAELLHIPKGSFVPHSTTVQVYKGQIAAAKAAQAAAEKEAELERRKAADANIASYRTGMLGIAAGNEADRRERAAATQREAEQKQSDAVDAARKTELESAATWKQNELDKLKRDGPALGRTPEQEEDTIQREWLRRSQAGYDRWGHAIRRRPGGTAPDFQVYPNGSVVQTTQPYGAGGKPVPIGDNPLPPAPSTPPTGTGGRGTPSATPAGGGGRGGRGNVPPPVKTGATSTAKTFDVPTPSGSVIHFPDRATAEKWLAERGAVLTSKQ